MGDTAATADVMRKIDELTEAVAHGAPDVEPGSSLAGDDAKTAPYHLSHAAWSAVVIAADHLMAYQALVLKAQRTQPWAHHTLLRAAIENSATAVWLVTPATRKLRIERRLRLAHADIGESAKAKELHGLESLSGRTLEQRLNEVAVLARRAGITDGTKWRSYAQVMREAAPGARMEPDTLELAWRLGSGLAHGRNWASIGLLHHADHSAPGDPVRNLEMTAPLEQLDMFALTALSLAAVGRRYYEQRRHHYAT